jgi:hypothetical protein
MREDTMQPIVEYAQRSLDRLWDRFRAVVQAMLAEGLNWRPGDETTNSLAMIVRHVTFGQRLILNMALGIPPNLPLDERTRGLHNDPATHDELLGLLDSTAEERRAFLAQLDALDLGEAIAGPLGPPRPRFSFVAHTVAEAAQHIGHAELTRQLWEQRDAK